eukprot:6173090-Pleurochrysis_carterae.AAC.3
MQYMSSLRSTHTVRGPHRSPVAWWHPTVSRADRTARPASTRVTSIHVAAAIEAPSAVTWEALRRARRMPCAII